MGALLAKYVWLERVIVVLGNIGVNVGLCSAGQEKAIAAGGVIGAVTLVQVVLALVTHYQSAYASLLAYVEQRLAALVKLPTGTLAGNVVASPAPVTGTPTVAPSDAAAAAGKAL